ncbi:MAG TPA: ribosomal protein S18-alanine N-acetyltransferase [Terriglobia bacterium]|nr:ribosomal protein S18-alanine N-acetyltransferase [Terriglobia bacterium]
MHNHSGGIKIRLFAQDDLNAVLKIHRACKGVGVWGARDYEQLAADPRGAILVAEQDGQMLPSILGFLAFYRLDGEAEIWNLGIAPAYRRRGIGRELLQEACRLLSRVRVDRLFLEVRESNFPALELYRSFGFVLQDRRKDYYQNPKEDALVLVYHIIESGD